jgi:hypothetical protein
VAESEIDARFFRDELAARPQMLAAQFGSRLGLMATAARVVHPGSAPLARAAMMARSAFGGVAEVAPIEGWRGEHWRVEFLIALISGALTAGVPGSATRLARPWRSFTAWSQGSWS